LNCGCPAIHTCAKDRPLGTPAESHAEGDKRRTVENEIDTDGQSDDLTPTTHQKILVLLLTLSRSSDDAFCGTREALPCSGACLQSLLVSRLYGEMHYNSRTAAVDMGAGASVALAYRFHVNVDLSTPT
jgi:hypothetical protein